MATVHPPTFNIDKLEGDVQHFLMICEAFSDDALDAFVQKYAYSKGKKLPANYASTVLLPCMKLERKVYQTTQHLYTLNPLSYLNEKGLDAFWVFLYTMDDVKMENVMKGPYPAQISYIKDDRIYHIVACKGDGATELAMAAQLEIETDRCRRRHPNERVDERFFFVFSNKENMEKAQFLPKSPSLFVTVEYPDGSRTPQLNFINPSQE